MHRRASETISRSRLLNANPNGVRPVCGVCHRSTRGTACCERRPSGSEQESWPAEFASFGAVLAHTGYRLRLALANILTPIAQGERLIAFPRLGHTADSGACDDAAAPMHEYLLAVSGSPQPPGSLQCRNPAAVSLLIASAIVESTN